jgi:hypothetical protein
VNVRDNFETTSAASREATSVCGSALTLGPAARTLYLRYRAGWPGTEETGVCRHED